MNKLRLAVAVSAAVAALSWNLAAASDLVVTPSYGTFRPVSGGPCVFVGSAAVGNPLSSPTLVRTDSRTGVYTRCPY